MSSLPKNIPRTFDLVQRDLEETLHRIGRAFDPKARIKLLKQLRELIEEADEIIQSEA